MPLIRDASAIYVGDLAAQKVYMGSDLVWAPASAVPGPEIIPGCIMALNAADAPMGDVVTWKDRSPAQNDMVAPGGAPVGNGNFVKIRYTDGAWSQYMVSVLPFAAVGGNHSSHTLLLSRHRGVRGTFMTWGGGNQGGAMDLWNYTDGSLIWHGSGAGYDTIPGPFFPQNAWVLIDVSYDATVGVITVCVDEAAPDTLGGLSLNTDGGNPFVLGHGSYALGSDFDLAELYIYDRVLTPEERAEVRAHLYDLIPTRLAWL